MTMSKNEAQIMTGLFLEVAPYNRGRRLPQATRREVLRAALQDSIVDLPKAPKRVSRDFIKAYVREDRGLDVWNFLYDLGLRDDPRADMSIIEELNTPVD